MKPQAKRTLPWMVLLSLLAGVLSFMKPASLLADSDDPPERVARLGSLRGTVSIEPAGVNEWSAASPNYPIATGDRVYTDNDGRTEVQIGETVARMWHDTDLTVTNLANNIIQLGLAQGTIRLRTFGIDSQTQVEIDTPNGALTITRPGDVRVDSYTGDGGTMVTVNSGEVELSGPGLSQRIGGGQSLRLLGTNPIQLSDVEMPEPDEFDGWSLDRDRHMMHSNSARYVSRQAPGYDDLDEYGDWSPQSDYGPVWYPRSVPAGWVPYRYGHWVWTGPWGWTWVEDEPWGYTPFHYGRWANIDNRWGWIPGPVRMRPIWSPALVAFVGGPQIGIGIGGGLSAWFPLGPGEPYAPWYHCTPRYVNQVNITNINVTRIVNVQNNYNVTNIRNINYVHRTGATTAVSAQDFRSARPVASSMIQVDPRRLAQAQVIPHPDINPTVLSVVPRPVTNVGVATIRPTLLTQGGRQAPAVPGARSQAVPYQPLPANAMQRTDALHPAGNPGATAHPGAIPAPARGSYNRGINTPAVNPGGMNAGGRPAIPATNQPAMNQGGRPNVPALGGMNPSGRPNTSQPAVDQSSGTSRPVISRQPVEAGHSTPVPAYGNDRTPQPHAGQPASPNQLAPQHVPMQITPVQRKVEQDQRPLVYRNETPAPRPTFQQQQPAMNQHPGRPLEPQQIDNLQQGRPAGPQRDQELIPHAQPQPRYQAQPQPQPRYSPPAQQQAQPQRPALQRNVTPEAQQHVPGGDHREHN